MRAAVLRGFGSVGIEEVPDPNCGPREAVIEVRCVQPSVTECMLIDGADIAFHDVLTSALANGPVRFGGHEFAGVVSEIGSQVSGLAVGQRVTAIESAPCGGCPACRKGRSDACVRPGVLGFTTPGAFAERVVVPASSVVALPEEVSWSAGAALQPLAAAVHAHAALGVRPGESVLVIGGGVMGLLAVALARQGNASRIALATRSERKRALGREFGADDVFDARDDVAMLAAEATGGLGYDVVVETAGGSPSAGLAGTATVDTAVRVVRRGGRVAIVSVLPNRAELPTGMLRTKSITLVHPRSGAGYYAATTSVFDHCVALVASGRVDVERLITHRLDGLDALPEALTITRAKTAHGAVNPAQLVLNP